MYLPDTNIFIRGLQGFEPESSFLTKIIQKNALAISVVVVAEFLAKSKTPQTETFKQLMVRFGVENIYEEVALQAAEYRKEQLGKTKKVIIVDCFLAAQAKLNNLILVTNNKSDFPMKDIKVVFPK